MDDRQRQDERRAHDERRALEEKDLYSQQVCKALADEAQGLAHLRVECDTLALSRRRAADDQAKRRLDQEYLQAEEAAALLRNQAQWRRHIEDTGAHLEAERRYRAVLIDQQNRERDWHQEWAAKARVDAERLLELQSRQRIEQDITRETTRAIENANAAYQTFLKAEELRRDTLARERVSLEAGAARTIERNRVELAEGVLNSQREILTNAFDDLNKDRRRLDDLASQEERARTRVQSEERERLTAGQRIEQLRKELQEQDLRRSELAIAEARVIADRETIHKEIYAREALVRASRLESEKIAREVNDARSARQEWEQREKEAQASGDRDREMDAAKRVADLRRTEHLLSESANRARQHQEDAERQERTLDSEKQKKSLLEAEETLRRQREAMIAMEGEVGRQLGDRLRQEEELSRDRYNRLLEEYAQAARRAETIRQTEILHALRRGNLQDQHSRLEPLHRVGADQRAATPWWNRFWGGGVNVAKSIAQFESDSIDLIRKSKAFEQAGQALEDQISETLRRLTQLVTPLTDRTDQSRAGKVRPSAHRPRESTLPTAPSHQISVDTAHAAGPPPTISTDQTNRH